MSAAPVELSAPAASRLRVCGALVNLRREPSHAAELVSQLVLGEEAAVLEERAGWLRVEGPDAYSGWAHARGLANGDVTGDELVWTRRQGLLLESSGAEAEPLCDLTLGARVWSTTSGAVRIAGGRSGWADPDGWLPVRELGQRFRREGAAVVGTALSLRGVPYLWGGTSSKAFDCSGFVQRVFGLHGVALPRDAWQQASRGQPIEPGRAGSELAPADLLFFAEGGGRVTHVAAALGGGGRFVHCSTSRAGVGVDGLDPGDELHSPALAGTLVDCRRVV